MHLGSVRWAPALSLAMALAMALAACQRDIDGRVIENPPAGEWVSYSRTYEEQRYSPLDLVNRQTVGKLGLAWWAQFDTDRGQEATPLVHDGVLYTTTAWSKVFAFDARTGAQLWAYDPKVSGERAFDACCDLVNRGVALWKGNVYVGDLDGRLIALNAKTGKPVWSVQTADPTKPYTITGAPRAVKGRILIGNGGAEYPVRGYLSAYDAATGKLDWRFYMTPNPKGEPDNAVSDKTLKEKAEATWGDGAWKLGGGGATVWEAITYDPKTDLVFVGTGNAGPWNDAVRSTGGDNLFAASIVALHPDTGQYAWHYQTTPRDAWDYDATQQLMAADLRIDGKQRRVIMQANKNGFFYVLDAASGQLIAADKFVQADWAARIDLKTGRPVESPTARYHDDQTSDQSPGSFGAHNWQGMALNPKEGLIYIPAMISRQRFGAPENFTYLEGDMNVGIGRRPQAGQPPPRPPPSEGELVAWDPIARTARWRVDFPQWWRGGVLATAGGLVFQTAGEAFQAFDASTGKLLWSYDTAASALAAACTYEIGGEQYIALMVGYGGGAFNSNAQPRRPGRLLVFKLGATNKLPAFPAPIERPRLDLTAAEATKGDATRGTQLYGHFCGYCHSGGVFLPDLTRSPLILSAAGFKTIVLDGALKDQGMSPFSRFLNEADVEAIRAGLLERAKTAPMTAQPR